MGLKKNSVRAKLQSVIFLTLLIGLAGGCGKKDADELISLKGRVEKVRRTTDTSGEITVRFFNEKQNKELVGSAMVTPETRIEKNGQALSLLDVQEGAQVNGQVRSFKKDGQRMFQAVLIQIDSPQASSGQ